MATTTQSVWDSLVKAGFDRADVYAIADSYTLSADSDEIALLDEGLAPEGYEELLRAELEA
jgi:ubiquitin